MNLTRSKTTATTFIIMLIMISLAAGVQLAQAQRDIKTAAFLSVVPNPVGVDQSVLVSLMIQPIPPTATDVFTGMSVEITKPDGTKETRGPFESSPIGSTTFSYTPAQIGTYMFQFNYAGDSFTFGNRTYLPSSSPITELVVQEDPIPDFQETPLPTDYWTRPINAQNRNWYSISGNWLFRTGVVEGRSFGDVTGYNPYSEAPMAPHVMWTRELTLGGLTGGEYGSYSYYGGHAYEPKFAPGIIMNGRLYYKIYQSGFSGAQGTIGTGFVCVDLRTGEELFRNTEGIISHGQLYNFISPNQMGPIAYLWDLNAGAFTMYDAFTGDWFMTFEGAPPFPPAPVTYGEDGTIYAYYLSPGNFMMWNSSKAFDEAGFNEAQPSGLIQFRPKHGIYNWSTGIEWSVSVPLRQATDIGYPSGGGFAMFLFPAVTEGVAVAYGGGVTNSPLHVGYDLATGQELWAFDRRDEAGGEGRTFPVFTASGEGTYAQFEPTSMTWLGYDVHTGQRKWISDPMDYPFGQYIANSNGGIIVDGLMYVADMQGTMHAIDAETGKQVWKFNSGNSGSETPYGSWPMGSGPIIADGVVFTGIGEHSPTNPLMRGGHLFALDAKTGEEIWRMNGWISVTGIADGYLVGYNLYDNRIYAIGKGPSATSVTAPKLTITLGDSVVIEGTVTDQSMGSVDTAAISDEDIGEWMAYLHQQQALPSDAKGVTVTLDTLDPNGNFVHIGEVTSEMSGVFAHVYTPDVPGLHKIIATFAGSESYGSSYAETFMNVDPAPQATAPPDPTPAPPTDTYVMGFGIAIIAVVIIFGILLLRKK